MRAALEHEQRAGQHQQVAHAAKDSAGTRPVRLQVQNWQAAAAPERGQNS
jgi:hypothetical protein